MNDVVPHANNHLPLRLGVCQPEFLCQHIGGLSYHFYVLYNSIITHIIMLQDFNGDTIHIAVYPFYGFLYMKQSFFITLWLSHISVFYHG